MGNIKKTSFFSSILKKVNNLSKKNKIIYAAVGGLVLMTTLIFVFLGGTSPYEKVLQDYVSGYNQKSISQMAKAIYPSTSSTEYESFVEENNTSYFEGTSKISISDFKILESYKNEYAKAKVTIFMDTFLGEYKEEFILHFIYSTEHKKWHLSSDLDYIELTNYLPGDFVHPTVRLQGIDYFDLKSNGNYYRETRDGNVAVLKSHIKAHKGSNITIPEFQISRGNNFVNISVQSQDGVNIKTYTLQIYFYPFDFVEYTNIIAITKYYDINETELIIPRKIGNKVVQVIDYGAFGYSVNLQKIYIPKEVERIYMGAFDGCVNLSIFLESESTTLYTDWNPLLRPTYFNLDDFSVQTYQFSTNGGSYVVPTFDFFVEEMPIPTRANFYFAGWFTKPDFSGMPVMFPFYGRGTTFYAKWTTAPAGAESLTFEFVEGYEENYYVVSNYDGSSIIVHIPETHNNLPVRKIKDSAFNNSNIYMVVIPSNIKEIGSYAFQSCLNLSIVIFNNGLTSIGNRAFSGSKLKHVSLPEGLEFVGDDAFSVITLKTIAIPSTLNDAHKLFEYNPSLTNIFVSSNNPNYKSENGNLLSKDGIIFYIYAGGKLNETYNIPQTVTTIETNAFGSALYLQHLVLPDSIKTVKPLAFYGMDNLKTINLPDSIESINSSAFEKDFLRLIAPSENSVVYINNWLVGYVGNITEIEIKNTVKGIAENALYNSSLIKVTFENGGNVKVLQQAFSNNQFLTEVDFGNSISAIKQYTFENCESLQQITLGSLISEIENYAFNHNITTVFVTKPLSEGIITLANYGFTTSIENIYFLNEETKNSYSTQPGWIYFADKMSVVS